MRITLKTAPTCFLRLSNTEENIKVNMLDTSHRAWVPIVFARLTPLVALLLMVSFLWQTAAAQTVTASAPASNIRIGIIGDQTFSTNIQASYGVLQQGVHVLSGQPIDIVLHVGDLVESSLSPSQVTALFNQATGILDGL